MDVSRQCTARSKQSQERCKRAAILGGNVCVIHGGAAPQVKRVAEERFADATDSAIDTLVDLLADESGSVRLGAAKDILDRAGYKPKEKVDLNVGYGRLTDSDLEARIAELEDRARSLPRAS